MLGIGIVIGFICGGTIAAVCVHLWHIRQPVEQHSDVRSPEQILEHEEALQQPVTMAPEQTPKERIGVTTAVTRIMQKRGLPIHEEHVAVVSQMAAARHRADTRAIKVIRQD